MDTFILIIFSVIVIFAVIGVGVIIYNYQHPLTEQQKLENCIYSMDNHTLIIDNTIGCNNLHLENKGWYLYGVEGNDGFFSHSFLVYKK